MTVSESAPTSASVLDLPHDDGLLGHVVRVANAIDRVLDDIARGHGISAADYLVLGVVRRSPGYRSSPTTIAEVLHRTTGGMSLALDRLEAAGWLQRRPDPDDGRRVVVEATPAGIALAKQVNDDLHRWEEALPLAPDQRQAVAAVLSSLTEALSSGR